MTDHRSSWVRFGAISGQAVYVKTYDYPRWRDRLRGALRNTLVARSRARREWDALTWLQGHGFAAPTPLAVLECRRFGLLRRAVLISAAIAGEPVDAMLPRLDAVARDAVLTAVESLVAALHERGFRHRNLDLRNLVATPEGNGFRVAVLDAPRYRLRPAGPTHDRLARADWRRLAASLDAALPQPLPKSR